MPKATKLKNGLSLVIKPMKGTRAVTILAMVPVGSRYENDKISGASHFVEHLMFKGTDKRPTTLDISRELDAVGAEYNAFTDKEYTGYYIKIDSRKSGLALDILSDMLFHSKFDAEEVKREKGVILEEIKMYEDNPASAVSLNFDRLFFGKHPLGRDIAGTKKTIGAITRKELYDYYKSVYRPANMVLVVAGGVSKVLNRQIIKYFGRDFPAAGGRVIAKKDFAKYAKKFSPAARLSVEKRKLDQANVMIGFPGVPFNDPRRYPLSVMVSILGGGMSSRLFTEVRERRGLAYKIRVRGDRFRDCGIVWIDAGLDTKRLGEAFKVIRAEIKKMREKPVSAKELADAKSNFSGSFALMSEDSSAQANWYARKFLFEKDMLSYEEEARRINKVTAGQVQKAAREFLQEKNMKIAVISPLNKKKIIKTLK